MRRLRRLLAAPACDTPPTLRDRKLLAHEAAPTKATLAALCFWMMLRVLVAAIALLALAVPASAHTPDTVDGGPCAALLESHPARVEPTLFHVPLC